MSPTLELATNNPFRQRLSVGPTSPASATERYSFAAQPHERPKSRNPFLDVFGDDDSNDYNEPHRHTTQRANSFDASAATHRSGLSGSAAELFVPLTYTLYLIYPTNSIM